MHAERCLTHETCDLEPTEEDEQGNDESSPDSNDAPEDNTLMTPFTRDHPPPWGYSRWTQWTASSWWHITANHINGDHYSRDNITDHYTSQPGAHQGAAILYSAAAVWVAAIINSYVLVSWFINDEGTPFTLSWLPACTCAKKSISRMTESEWCMVVAIHTIYTSAYMHIIKQAVTCM